MSDSVEKRFEPDIQYIHTSLNINGQKSIEFLHHCLPVTMELPLSKLGRVSLPNKLQAVAYPGILLGGGGSTNSVEDRENGDLGAVAP